MVPSNLPVVLLVDDHEDTREMYAEFLRVSGFEVVEAGDAAEAIAVGAARIPAILVTDFRMPGPPTATDLCRHFSVMGVPVIAVTGMVRASEHAEVLAAGCRVVLLKPLSPDKLLSEVRHALGAAQHV